MVNAAQSAAAAAAYPPPTFTEVLANISPPTATAEDDSTMAKRAKSRRPNCPDQACPEFGKSGCVKTLGGGTHGKYRYSCSRCEGSWQQVPPHKGGSADGETPNQSIAIRKRTVSKQYNCGRCGQPKKGHVCKDLCKPGGQFPPPNPADPATAGVGYVACPTPSEGSTNASMPPGMHAMQFPPGGAGMYVLPQGLPPGMQFQMMSQIPPHLMHQMPHLMPGAIPSHMMPMMQGSAGAAASATASSTAEGAPALVAAPIASSSLGTTIPMVAYSNGAMPAGTTGPAGGADWSSTLATSAEGASASGSDGLVGDDPSMTVAPAAVATSYVGDPGSLPTLPVASAGCEPVLEIAAAAAEVTTTYEVPGGEMGGM